ncbi:hypothetical protein CRUP_031799, partial [Coryphaenoides rupestris]
KLEVTAVNSTAIRVTWKPPMQGKQHGQIRGYQVIFSRLENDEPRGQPNIMDVALPEAQARGRLLRQLCLRVVDGQEKFPLGARRDHSPYRLRDRPP